MFARSIIELVMTEVGEGEKEGFGELVTETELDLEEGEYWDRMEEGRDDVAATEFDLRLWPDLLTSVEAVLRSEPRLLRDPVL